MWSEMMDEHLEDMLRTQSNLFPPVGFLKASNIAPYVHQRLADWLLETCEDFGCDREVFCCAMTIFGRYLTARPLTNIERLPLVGFASMFVACKQSGKCMRAASLCSLLGYIFSEEDLKQEEVAILNALNWRLDGPKPHDFLDQFLHRLPFTPSDQELKTLQDRAEVFLDMSYCAIAAAAVQCAIVGLDGIEGDASTQPLYTNIPPAFRASCFGLFKFFPTNGDKMVVASCAENIHRLYKAYNTKDAAAVPAPAVAIASKPSYSVLMSAPCATVC